MTINDEIRSLYDLFEEKINAGEIKELVEEFFTEDAIVTGHEAPFIKGKEGLIGMFSHVHSTQKDITIEMVETREGDDSHIYNIANTLGVIRENDAPAALKSLCIFRKTDAGLRCEVDFFALGAIE
jgi:ketosteroid isomerase-like protein